MAAHDAVAFPALRRRWPKSLFGASWYRVATLKPQIHRHAIFHRHDYRGQAWHVIEDRAGERFHRFAPSTYFLIGLMNGERTVDEIWRAAIEKLGDHAPSQDDVIRLLAQLHAADLIKTNMTAEADDLFRRFRAIGRQNLMKRLGSPFSMRLPLLDPDRFLHRPGAVRAAALHDLGPAALALGGGGGLHRGRAQLGWAHRRFLRAAAGALEPSSASRSPIRS